MPMKVLLLVQMFVDAWWVVQWDALLVVHWVEWMDVCSADVMDVM